MEDVREISRSETTNQNVNLVQNTEKTLTLFESPEIDSPNSTFSGTIQKATKNHAEYVNEEDGIPGNESEIFDAKVSDEKAEIAETIRKSPEVLLEDTHMSTMSDEFSEASYAPENEKDPFFPKSGEPVMRADATIFDHQLEDLNQEKQFKRQFHLTDSCPATDSLPEISLAETTELEVCNDESQPQDQRGDISVSLECMAGENLPLNEELEENLTTGTLTDSMPLNAEEFENNKLNNSKSRIGVKLRGNGPTKEICGSDPRIQYESNPELTVPEETVEEELVEKTQHFTLEQDSAVEGIGNEDFNQALEVAESASPVITQDFETEAVNPTHANVVHNVTEFHLATVQAAPINFSTDESHSENEEVVTTIAQEFVPEVKLEKVQSVEVPQHLMTVKKSSETMSLVNSSNLTPATEPSTEAASLQLQAQSVISDDEKTSIVPPGTGLNQTSILSGNENESKNSDSEIDFDTKYALFVEKVLPGHEVYYLPPINSKRKQVSFPRAGTLNQPWTRPRSSPLYDLSTGAMRAKSATLGAPHRSRHRLQPKPAVNDDYLFPDSVTPSKVEKALNEDETSTFDEKRNLYDVPFMDDDAFLPKKYRSVILVDDDSSFESEYLDEKIDLLGTDHLAEMDETSLHMSKLTYYNYSQI
ncbi:unnamed protein product [Mesocestoides corti]|uniref:Uncharacterized protein n=1 Tax=Mesocestoides corti TaxID=53468 RepID=A0A0R3UJ61_MESCO|nr:unnamed protein product [Mesocestoides corti]